MCEPVDEWPSKFDESLNLEKSRMNLSPEQTIIKTMTSQELPLVAENGFSFSSEPPGAEDDEVTESKIRAFLDDKIFELKNLQTTLFEEFLSISDAALDPVPVAIAQSKVVLDVSNVTSKGRIFYSS